jgi:hypothetical protein
MKNHELHKTEKILFIAVLLFAFFGLACLIFQQ